VGRAGCGVRLGRTFQGEDPGGPVVPIGFVSDHIVNSFTTLIFFTKIRQNYGMRLKRTPSLIFLNNLLRALATIVEEHVKGEITVDEFGVQSSEVLKRLLRTFRFRKKA